MGLKIQKVLKLTLNNSSQWLLKCPLTTTIRPQIPSLNHISHLITKPNQSQVKKKKEGLIYQLKTMKLFHLIMILIQHTLDEMVHRHPRRQKYQGHTGQKVVPQRREKKLFETKFAQLEKWLGCLQYFEKKVRQCLNLKVLRLMGHCHW